MKEEIFLFYKRILEPRIGFLKLKLSYYTKPVLKSKPAKNTFNYQYLLIQDNLNPIEYYLNKGINPLVIDIDESRDLDREYIYLVLGQYDQVSRYLSYLRKLNIKALLDQTWMTLENTKPLWKRRVSVVEAIYSDLMTEDIDQKDKYIIFSEKSEWIDFEEQIFCKYLENKEQYKVLVNHYLKEGWNWQRINLITCSIILEAISEYHAFNTPKAVLITQSVKTAKNYCEDVDYKIINALLDNYFKGLV